MNGADLVLGMCGGYGPEAALPFVASLFRAGFDGECLLLGHANPQGTAEALARAGARLVFPALPAAVPDPLSYNVARWRLFAGLLAARPDVARVLLADVRDVIFQRHPLDWLGAGDAPGGPHLFAEHPDTPVGRCIWTSSWIRYRYGDAALPPLAEFPVACSGIAAGGRTAVLAFCRAMAGEIDETLPARKYMAGYDQGVANVLVHTGRLPGALLHPFGRGAALHLGNAPEAALRLNDAGEVLGEDGAPVAILHQYDRHPRLAARLAAYPAPV